MNAIVVGTTAGSILFKDFCKAIFIYIEIPLYCGLELLLSGFFPAFVECLIE